MLLVHRIANQVELFLGVTGHVPEVATVFEKVDENFVKDEFLIVALRSLKGIQPAFDKLSLVQMLTRTKFHPF